LVAAPLTFVLSFKRWRLDSLRWLTEQLGTCRPRKLEEAESLETSAAA
jgi:hypothetical protein